jgi:signal transduction histidine kinase
MLLSLALLAVSLASPGVLGAPSPEGPYRIVVIQGSDAMLPIGVLRAQAMRRAITGSVPGVVDIHTESLDQLRFSAAELEPTFVDLLRVKYAQTKIDAIVAVGDYGLDFALRQRATLWSDAPVVFYAVPPEALVGRSLPPGVTGIVTRTEVADTLALARRLQPDAKRVVIAAGAAAGDMRRAARMADVVARDAPDLEVVRLDGKSIAGLKSALASVKRDSIVMYEGVFRDADGATFFPSEILDELARVSAAPMYGHFETHFGRGIVGGALHDGTAEGRRAGELVAALLNGHVAASAPVESVMSATCAVDVRQLERWGIPDARVPDGCTQGFRTPGLVESYPWQVAGAVALILLQALLLATLLLQWRQKRRSATETQRMRVDLAHAARLATVGELTAAISHEINQPLGAVQSSADAAEMLLDSPAPRLDRVREILRNIRAANHRASEVVRRLRTLLQKHESTRQPFDFNETIDDVLRMVGAELRRRRIAVESASAQRPMWVEGDPVQIQQVVLNLILNAMDAIGEAPAERRRIRARLATDGEGSAILQVSDRGAGIAEENLPHLFESFFTTKPHGMGLGLSVSHSIVKAHGGRIQARNNSHGGATFAISLPLGNPPDGAMPRIAA